jgi:transcriptional antiterminator RfaH
MPYNKQVNSENQVMDLELIANIPQWYVVNTHVKQEDRAENNLRVLNVETFCPKVREKRRNGFNGLVKYYIKPLFPGYIFAKLVTAAVLNKVSFTRGVRRVVRFGNYPAVVSEQIIELIRSQIFEDGFVYIGNEIKPGDKVVINDGAFKDFVGIFEEFNEMNRVKILLTTLNYQAHILINQEFVSIHS